MELNDIADMPRHNAQRQCLNCPYGGNRESKGAGLLRATCARCKTDRRAAREASAEASAPQRQPQRAGVSAPPVTCTLCQATFRSKNQLFAHLDTEHGVERPSWAKVSAPALLSSLELLERQLLELIDAGPDRRVWAAKVPGLFQERFCTVFDFKGLGHTKLKSLIEAMPAVIMRSVGLGQEYLCRAGTLELDDIADMPMLANDIERAAQLSTDEDEKAMESTVADKLIASTMAEKALAANKAADEIVAAARENAEAQAATEKVAARAQTKAKEDAGYHAGHYLGASSNAQKTSAYWQDQVADLEKQKKAAVLSEDFYTADKIKRLLVECRQKEAEAKKVEEECSVEASLHTSIARLEAQKR